MKIRSVILIGTLCGLTAGSISAMEDGAATERDAKRIKISQEEPEWVQEELLNRAYATPAIIRTPEMRRLIRRVQRKRQIAEQAKKELFLQAHLYLERKRREEGQASAGQFFFCDEKIDNL